MKKKKVLHIVEAFGGGIFSFLVDLINKTNDEFEIVVCYSKRKQTPEKFEKYFKNNIKFIEVKNFGRSINPIKDVRAFFEVRKIIKQEKPDIIHLHSSKAGFIGRFAVNSRKIKMLYNPHGFSFLMRDSSKIKRMIYWIIEKIGSFRKCTIVGCSKGEYEEALKLTKNSICINNGVNIDKLKEETKGLKEKDIKLDNLKICTVGRIGYQKNPELFNEIAKSFPNIKFTWIGEGELKDKLNSENITVTGWKERKEVLKILNENDIFILTSLWEGLPIALLEAMYMKKICIVSNCIGNKDVIENEKNGFVADTLEEYIKIINKIKNNEFDLNKIKENEIKDLEKEYNVNVMTEKYKKEYEGK